MERSPREKRGKENRADLLESADCWGIWRKKLSHLCPGLNYKGATYPQPPPGRKICQIVTGQEV